MFLQWPRAHAAPLATFLGLADDERHLVDEFTAVAQPIPTSGPLGLQMDHCNSSSARELARRLRSLHAAELGCKGPLGCYNAFRQTVQAKLRAPGWCQHSPACASLWPRMPMSRVTCEAGSMQ